MDWLAIISWGAAVISLVILLPLGLWQVVVGLMGLFSMRKLEKTEEKTHRFAVISCARNEEAVIGQLLDSLHNQRYPREAFDLFVVADNCTDATAAVAREHGAFVLERQDTQHVGKGYALQWALDQILQQGGYDAVVIFDADNLAEPNFLAQTNEALCSGADVTQGYRAIKNLDASWISGCYALYWLGVMRFFYCARRNLGLSALVGGTGFAFKASLIEETGWKTYTITEDGEFSVQQILAGNRIVPLREAVFYDEQPTTFSMSLRQRHRWVVGGMQICRRYLRPALRCIRKGNWSAVDALMYMLLIPVLGLGTIFTVVSAVTAVLQIPFGFDPTAAVVFGVILLLGMLAIQAVALLTTLLERLPMRVMWKSVLLFPLFMLPMAYMSVAALFRDRAKWKPIAHTDSRGIRDMGE